MSQNLGKASSSPKFFLAGTPIKITLLNQSENQKKFVTSISATVAACDKLANLNRNKCINLMSQKCSSKKGYETLAYAVVHTCRPLN